MSKANSVDIAIEKYCFQPYETSFFVLHVLKKCGESIESLDEETVHKFIENDEAFESWISSVLEKEFREGVAKATINYHGKAHSIMFFKEPQIDSSHLILPVPYIARLLKIVILKELGESETSIREDAAQGNGFAIDFSNEELYILFNPIKILNGFSSFIIVTNMGIEHIKPSELVKVFESTAKKAKKRKTRKRKRRSRKRKSKKSKR